MQNFKFLDAHSVDDFADQLSKIDYNKTIQILKDLIDHAPFISAVVSKLVEESIYAKETIKPDIEEILKEKVVDPDVNLSRCVYATRLGAKTNLSDQIKCVSSQFGNLSLECTEIENFDNKVQNFYCYSVFKELSFDKKECFEKIKTLPFESIVDTVSKDQSLFNISILIQMCKFYGFLEVLEHKISLFKMKKQIIASIFINLFSEDVVYSNSCSAEDNSEKEILKRLISDEVLEYCLKVANKKYLGLLLGQTFENPTPKQLITQSDFERMPFQKTDDVFDAFLELTSPSVSHFFSYLEYYKDKFFSNISNKDKKLFLQKICDFHKDNNEYCEIVIDKLMKAGF